MRFSINRDTILKPLQMVAGVVEKRQTLPILSNILIDNLSSDQLKITGTDLEVELSTNVDLETQPEMRGKITVPGRKLMDICRNLPEDVNINLSLSEKGKLILQSGKSRFTLSTLPSTDFPVLEPAEGALEFTMKQSDLLFLLQRTHFAMATQDVRYYLNGMLFELKPSSLTTAATDGHRLAVNTVNVPSIENKTMTIIVPRKGILELMRLLSSDDSEVKLLINQNHMTVIGEQFTFTSKLIDGNFPEYDKVIPRQGDKEIILDKSTFKQSLTRASVLSNEKFRGIQLQFSENSMKVMANNPEQEEAIEEIDINYTQEAFKIGFNVSYLLDVINTVQSDTIKMTLSGPDASALVEEIDSDGSSIFVVMPMRL